MKNIIKLLCALFVFLNVYGQMSNAQWEQVTSPPGGVINALLKNGDTIFCMVQTSWEYFLQGSGKLYRSFNNGRNWTVSDSNIGPGIAFARLGSTIFYGMYGSPISAHCLLSSSNQGSSWDSGSLKVPVYSLLIKRDTLFAGTTSGVYLSPDTGKNWIAANTGLPTNATIYSIATYGNYLIAGSNSGLFKSSNGGKSWDPMESSQSITADTVFALLFDGKVVFAGSNKGLYRSPDSGSTWLACTSGIPNDVSVTALTATEGIVFTGSKNEGIFISADNGLTWKKANTGFTRTPVLSVTANSGEVIAGTNGGGILLSADGGKTWSSVSGDLPFPAQVNTFGVFGSTIFAGTPVGIFSSRDNGMRWTTVNAGLPENNQTFVFATLDSTVFVGTNESGVYSSLNGSHDWKKANKGLTNNDIRALIARGSFLYAGTSNGIFVSQDRGNSWSPINDGLDDTSVISLAEGSSRLFALMQYGYGSKVYSFNYSSQRWDSSKTFYFVGRGSSVVTAFASDGNDLLIGSYIFGSVDYGNGLIRSTDNGRNFAHIDSGLPSNSWVWDILKHNNTVLIGTGSGVYVSSCSDYSWIAQNAGLPMPQRPPFGGQQTFIQHLIINDTYLFAATDVGILWRLPLSSVLVKQPKVTMTPQLPLSVFHPKGLPTNFCISFSLDRPEKTSLEIYNLLGHKCATLVDKKNDSGLHTFYWDIRGKPAGCYTVRLKIGSNIKIKTVMAF